MRDGLAFGRDGENGTPGPDIFEELAGHEPPVTLVVVLDEEQHVAPHFARDALAVRNVVLENDAIPEIEAFHPFLVRRLARADEDDPHRARRRGSAPRECGEPLEKRLRAPAEREHPAVRDGEGSRRGPHAGLPLEILLVETVRNALDSAPGYFSPSIRSWASVVTSTRSARETTERSRRSCTARWRGVGGLRRWRLNHGSRKSATHGIPDARATPPRGEMRAVGRARRIHDVETFLAAEPFRFARGEGHPARVGVGNEEELAEAPERGEAARGPARRGASRVRRETSAGIAAPKGNPVRTTRTPGGISFSSPGSDIQNSPGRGVTTVTLHERRERYLTKERGRYTPPPPAGGKKLIIMRIFGTFNDPPRKASTRRSSSRP